MSTRSTLAHGPGFHLYHEVFDEDYVYLQVEGTQFEAGYGRVMVLIPVHLPRDARRQRRSGAGRTGIQRGQQHRLTMWAYQIDSLYGFGAPFAQESGVKSECGLTNSMVRKPTFIAFDSRLAPFTNDILRKRYGEKTSVDDTLAWLVEQGVSCSREAYQKYLRRLLHHLPDAQALETGVELPMLHAVRRRLQLPLAGRPLWEMPYVRGRRAEP